MSEENTSTAQLHLEWLEKKLPWLYLAQIYVSPHVSCARYHARMSVSPWEWRDSGLRNRCARSCESALLGLHCCGGGQVQVNTMLGLSLHFTTGSRIEPWQRTVNSDYRLRAYLTKAAPHPQGPLERGAVRSNIHTILAHNAANKQYSGSG